MTRQAALKICQTFWGKTAAVQMTTHGARIGKHGEYVASHVVSNAKGSGKAGRYLCMQCSTKAIDAEAQDDFVERNVWHKPGGWQTQYKIGIVMMRTFFEVRAEAESFEAAIAIVRAKRKANEDARIAREQTQAATI